MRVELRVEAASLVIDTQNMELLARWLVEQFNAIDWRPSTWCTVTVWPGWAPRRDGTGQPDWLADSRIITEQLQVRSPEDVVKMLAGQIQRARALTEGATDPRD